MDPEIERHPSTGRPSGAGESVGLPAMNSEMNVVTRPKWRWIHAGAALSALAVLASP